VDHAAENSKLIFHHLTSGYRDGWKGWRIMMIYDMEASGKRLKELRKQAGKTQEQVAEAVGLEPGTISRIERGVKGMSIDSLLMFSEIYGVSTDYILKGDETMTPSDALLEELGALVQKYKSL
jgi:DNA-binding XRE family transcriptional regulator